MSECDRIWRIAIMTAAEDRVIRCELNLSLSGESPFPQMILRESEEIRVRIAEIENPNRAASGKIMKPPPQDREVRPGPLHCGCDKSAHR
jgi:hypothetical protein